MECGMAASEKDFHCKLGPHPDKRDPAMTPSTHCQICGRAILANTGLIAHHGYTRPGSGWQTASCFGARWKPYEIACDALPPAIRSCDGFRKMVVKTKADYLSDPPAELVIEPRQYTNEKPVTVTRPDGFKTDKQPGSWRSRTYEAKFWSLISAQIREIRSAEESLKYMRQRLADWPGREHKRKTVQEIVDGYGKPGQKREKTS